MCEARYPAYYYDVSKAACFPFVYSGCDGNGNRFLTLSQCETTCKRYKALSAEETVCLLPVAIGIGHHNETCRRDAGYRYYYNNDYGRCGIFWYMGCGGNDNRFYTIESCRHVCRTVNISHLITEIDEPKKCFEEIKVGSCGNVSASYERTEWAYNVLTAKCETFRYSGCGGTSNRFATYHACNSLCGGLIKPVSEQCAFYPDWGPCNELRYMWFYNMSLGTCEQFLWGGCGGNTNRFETFEICQHTCENPVDDVCSEPLDRGRWCEPMSNRYFFNSNTQSCKGFHYTGCGESENNFLTLEDCENRCMNRAVLINANISSLATLNYSAQKPLEKPSPIEHQHLIESGRSNFKTEEQWVRSEQCVGFRYNVSGELTKLNAYLCVMEHDGACEHEILRHTDGLENCYKRKPWLSGDHLYSWFFTLERTSPKRTVLGEKIQFANQTLASLLILTASDCDNLC
ncbi:hypothetical protein AB6A40_004317 [Gnathostoma spinigerum]|uniref:BPTI/Kunitz inhibitor domain-containing protein n=1 Tax=Gnathostoma spinigerum TaxID=75299 RepID=A0ABD6EKX2_9BILA